MTSAISPLSGPKSGKPSVAAGQGALPLLPRLLPPWNGIALPRLADQIARSKPDQPAFHDAPDAADWLGQPPRILDWATLAARARRFARQTVTTGLKPGDAILVALPNGTAFPIAYLGALQAGLVPVVTSPALDVDRLRAIAELTRAQAIVTTTRLGEIQPASIMRDVAAQLFAIRAVFAFGGECPEGVIDLDAWTDDDDLEPLDGARASAPDAVGLVTIEAGDRLRALQRSQTQLIAEAVALTSTAHIGPRATLITTLMPASAFGVIAGLVLPLLVRAEVHCHGLFSSRVLRDQITANPQASLLAPAAIEAALSDLEPLGALPPSIIFLRRAEAGIAPAAVLKSTARRIVDVTAMGEAGQFVLPRTSPIRRAPLPQNWRQPGTRIVEDDTLLLQARIGEDDRLSLRGFGVPSPFGEAVGARIRQGLATMVRAVAGDAQTFSTLPAGMEGQGDGAADTALAGESRRDAA